MNKTLAFVAALALIGAAALSLLAAAAAAPSQSVSLRVIRTQDPNTRLFRLSFSGVISSGAGGQEVTVLQQTCGQSFATAIAGAQTRDGGAWNAEPASLAAVAASATYRARWIDVESEPVAIHPPMPIFLLPSARNRMQVMVQTGNVQQDMRGRIVLFQRLRNRTWNEIGVSGSSSAARAGAASRTRRRSRSRGAGRFAASSGAERRPLLRDQRDGEGTDVRRNAALLAAALLPGARRAALGRGLAHPERPHGRPDIVCATEATGTGATWISTRIRTSCIRASSTRSCRVPQRLLGTSTLDSELVAVRAAQLTGLGARVLPAGSTRTRRGAPRAARRSR